MNPRNICSGLCKVATACTHYDRAKTLVQSAFVALSR